MFLSNKKVSKGDFERYGVFLNNTNYIRKQLVSCLLCVIHPWFNTKKCSFFDILVLSEGPFGTKCETKTRWGTTTVLSEDIMS